MQRDTPDEVAMGNVRKDERSPKELGLAVGYLVEQVACIVKVFTGKPEELDEQALMRVWFSQGFENEGVRLFQLIDAIANLEVML